MFNAKELGKKIAEIRSKENFLQGEFAELMGVSKNTLSYYERGINKPDAEFFCTLSEKFNVDLHWLIMGNSKLAKAQASVNDNYTLVPRYNVAASAGSGAFIDTEKIKDEMSFSTQWLNHIGLNVKNAALLNANGDSMEPTIKDRSILLLKTDEDGIKDGSIYVIQISGQTFVKRLKRDLKGIQIISDNPLYEPQHLTYAELDDNPITIAGRVVWFGSYA